MHTAPAEPADVTSSVVEDYLKQIYLESQTEAGPQPVGTGQLAQVMGVTPGTATSMLKSLAGAGLVAYQSRRGARLTEEGERRALGMLRRHRLLEHFLVRVLGLDWSEVHEEAEALEHAVSDRVLARIDALVGYPTVDPHGDPIPRALGGHVEGAGQSSLATCPLGVRLVVSRIRDQTADFLRFVERVGLMPGEAVTVETRDRQAGTVAVRLAGGMISVGLAAGGKIGVVE